MTYRLLPCTALLLAGTLAAQTQPAGSAAPGQTAATVAASSTAHGTAPGGANETTQPAAQSGEAAVPGTITVPAGTKVLLELRSAINTKSARPGDGVYLSSTFPVVQGNRVVIPEGVYVQGMVDSVVRPGRMHGKAQLNMHFTSLIFPNGSVVEIPGVVNSLPGAQNQTVRGDEGTIEQTGGSNKAHNAGETAKVAVPTGATVGAIGGLNGGHPLAGGIEGAAAGLAAAGIVALFTHNADVNIPSGTQVEMVLQRPLILEPSNLNGPTLLVPATAQPQPMPKPGAARQHFHGVCPAGGLGCG
jgi:hypothetical protein